MGRLQGKVTFVTGAASGIGYACAKRFAEEGAVVVGLDVQESDAWSEVEKLAPGSAFHVVDVRDEAALKAAADATVEAFGRIDGCVTSAGVASGGPVQRDVHRNPFDGEGAKSTVPGLSVISRCAATIGPLHPAGATTVMSSAVP